MTTMTRYAADNEPPSPDVLPPCPPWCRLREGHGFASITVDYQGVTREHGSEDTEVGSLWQQETYRDGCMTVGPVLVGVYQQETELAELTATEARARAVEIMERAHRMAGELETLADRVDSLT
ncbi:MAG: hypothetical protein H0T85_03890 [Geodermatophilaceae bacterium]|nr:hypothetical protein [Geodermatophilaceae bacterium]